MRPPTRSTRSQHRISADSLVPTILASLSTPESISTRTPSPIRTILTKEDMYNQKKARHRISDFQLQRLEALFEQTTHPSRAEKQTLGDDIGMDLKTVTIWFQNKRQTTRRRNTRLELSGIAQATSFCSRGSSAQQNVAAPCHTPLDAHDVACARAPGITSRLPLSTVLQANGNVCVQGANQDVPEVALSGLVSTSKGLLYSPEPGYSLLHSDKTLKLSSQIIDQNCAQNTFKNNNENGDGTKKRRNLEWACARMEKRRRVCESDDALKQPHLSDHLESGLTDDDSIEGPGQQILAKEKTKGITKTHKSIPAQAAKLPVISSGGLDVSIPLEYWDLFPADVVLGASLLLLFKNSDNSVPDTTVNADCS